MLITLDLYCCLSLGDKSNSCSGPLQSDNYLRHINLCKGFIQPNKEWSILRLKSCYFIKIGLTEAKVSMKEDLNNLFFYFFYGIFDKLTKIHLPI